MGTFIIIQIYLLPAGIDIKKKTNIFVSSVVGPPEKSYDGGKRVNIFGCNNVLLAPVLDSTSMGQMTRRDSV